MEKSIVEKVKKAAIVESKEKRHRDERAIKYREEWGVSKNTLINPIFTRIIIHLLDEPVFVDEFKSFDPNVRCTNGRYAIRYLPKSDKRRTGKHKQFCFQIIQDLIHSKVQICSYRHWLQYCQVIPELAWLNRNCPELCSDLFDLAAKHPGIPFWFGVGLLDYDKKIQKKVKERNKNQSTFVNFVCSIKEYNESYKHLKLFEEPTKNDIIKQMNEADKEYFDNEQ